ncbi:MAG: PSP1 domain-containing protein [Planctomycetota bacterium]
MIYVASVHYGRMNHSENFFSREGGIRMDDQVVVKTPRGIELGIITSHVKEQERDDVKGLGEIMRKATEDDIKIAEHISNVKEPDEKQYCNEQIKANSLPMKLADVEHLFGGDKIIFYFLADGRVDFRELVKNLAKKYRTRIEMRQIGVRDEARLLADYEHCGRELCCRTFMTNLEPVMMRMAKLQKTTLDPSKISGHCGRLMCCLRFEDETYAELKKQLPQKGTLVVTEEVTGEVLDYDILNQTCFIETTEGERITIHNEDIVERKGKGKDRGNRSNRNDKRNSNRNENKSENSRQAENKNTDSRTEEKQNDKKTD